MVGALFTVEPSAAAGLAIKVEVSRADYWDVRVLGTKYNTNMMYHDTARLPGGYFTLVPPAGAKIIGGTARVSLYTASLAMTLRVATATGTHDVTLGAVVAADRPGVLLIEGSALASERT